MSTFAGRVGAVPRLPAALLTALAFVGCASASGGEAAPEAAAAASEQTPANMVTGDQLRQTNTSNLWEAIRRLRPLWLRARADISLTGDSGGGEPIVYVNGVRYGEVRTLQQMNYNQVRSVEFIDGRDATTRFGTGHGAGVILVDTTRE